MWPRIRSDLTLRQGREDDAELLLEWRNDAQTVAASRTGAVDPAGHEGWLSAVLRDPDHHLLIVERNGWPIGQVRFDRLRGFEYEISVGLEAASRGSGLGAKAIREGCRWLWRRTNATTVVAEVDGSNDASLHAFHAAGFRPRGHVRDGLIQLSLPRPEPFAVSLPPDADEPGSGRH